MKTVEEHKRDIDALTRYQLCELWRFAPSGHPYFNGDTEVGKYFLQAWATRGGFTPEISKSLSE